jgi:hypothetical protein
MIHEYIETALRHAHYEIIKDEQPIMVKCQSCRGFGRLENPWKNAVKT